MKNGKMQFYTCAVCNKGSFEEGFLTKNHGAMIPGTNVQLPDFKPLYFLSADNVDFCSADCATTWASKNEYNTD